MQTLLTRKYLYVLCLVATFSLISFCREVYFGLERVLHGEDGAEGVSLKILETSPFTPGPPAMGLNGFGKVYC